jgi:hypothetical protein
MKYLSAVLMLLCAMALSAGCEAPLAGGPSPDPGSQSLTFEAKLTLLAFNTTQQAPMAWPTGAQAVITAPETFTLNNGAQVTLSVLNTGTTYPIDSSGAISVSIVVSPADWARYPNLRYAEEISFKAMVTGAPDYSGQEVTFRAGLSDINAVANIFTGIALVQPQLPEGSTCADGSTVVSCPVYNCPATTAGISIIPPSAGSTIPACSAVAATCSGGNPLPNPYGAPTASCTQPACILQSALQCGASCLTWQQQQDTSRCQDGSDYITSY